MALSVSSVCRNITPSATLRLNALAAEKRKQGLDIISLAAGEPDFPTPAHIRAAGKAAIEAGRTVYTATAGIPDLRAALARHYQEKGVNYQPNQLIVTTGAKQALVGALVALLNPGDEVLLPAPCWLSYPEMIRMAGGVPVVVNASAEEGYVPPIKRLEAAVSAKTKALILNNPSNPTGAVWSERQLRELAELAKKYDFAVISDEIYETLCYEGRSGTIFAGLSEDAFERTITVSGFSKAYAMTGWRLGYAAGPRAVIAAMDAWQGHATGNPCSVSQYAGLEAITGDQSGVEVMRLAFEKRRALLLSLLDGMPGVRYAVPYGAFYVLADVSALLEKSYRGEKLANAGRLCELLMEHALVSVVPGDGFFAPGCVRISYAIDESRLAEAGRRVKAFITELE